MGLDMYLKASKYVSGYSFNGDEKAAEYNDLLKLVGLSTEDISQDSPSAMINITVAYWRKANAIHAWFIDNCANGEDDCRSTYVSREQLEELLETCKSAISAYKSGDKIEAENLITPRGGFFFGSTEIDDWYLQDLEQTVEQLNKILNNPRLKGWSFEYQASW